MGPSSTASRVVAGQPGARQAVSSAACGAADAQLLPLGGIFHSSASGSLASLSHVTSQALSSRERWTPAQGIFQCSHHKQLARPINSHCESPVLHTVESVLKEPIIHSQGEGNALLSIHGMSHSQTSEQDAHPCQQLRPTSPGASSPDRFSEHSVSYTAVHSTGGRAVRWISKLHLLSGQHRFEI